MDILQEALTQGITPAIIIAIYLVIVKIIDNKKESNQAKINSKLVDSISKIGDFIDSITKNIVDKDREKCKTAINDSFKSSAYSLIKFVTNTIINNHIADNKETIIINIKNIVNTEYYNIYTTLNIYEINGIRISDILKKKWIDEIEKDILDSIYKEGYSNEEKILCFTNKINLRFNSYITYIINNSIK